MGPSREARHEAALAKTRAELAELSQRGAQMAGNAFSSVLLLKGEPGAAERAGEALLSGADGVALKAALQALGYAPEDWVGLAAWDDAGAPLAASLLREAISALGPTTVVACDGPAANALREAYAADLVTLESLEEAMLAEGVVVQVAGLRVLALGGFEAALADARQKQLMWARLKQLPPLGEPY